MCFWHWLSMWALMKACTVGAPHSGQITVSKAAFQSLVRDDVLLAAAPFFCPFTGMAA
jgi:uncharacterized membrane protein